nr:MAG TPA: hypothetical protein [Caudoviricetes sp.]
MDSCESLLLQIVIEFETPKVSRVVKHPHLCP